MGVAVVAAVPGVRAAPGLDRRAGPTEAQRASLIYQELVDCYGFGSSYESAAAGLCGGYGAADPHQFDRLEVQPLGRRPRLTMARGR